MRLNDGNQCLTVCISRCSEVCDEAIMSVQMTIDSLLLAERDMALTDQSFSDSCDTIIAKTKAVCVQSCQIASVCVSRAIFILTQHDICSVLIHMSTLDLILCWAAVVDLPDEHRHGREDEQQWSAVQSAWRDGQCGGSHY